MNRLSQARRAQVIRCLVEGNSIRSTCRMTDVAKGTVLKLLTDVGEACRRYSDEALVNLSCKRIQCDEVWCFCYAKDKNLPTRMKGQPGVGSVWTWTALCADCKLIAAWHVGTRDAACALEFMSDLSARLAHRVQITTDGHRAYLDAVEQSFGTSVDYAMLIKLYGEPPRQDEARYSPPTCIGTRLIEVTGWPDTRHVSTSYVERSNLTIRMSNRRFTRLTNAFSKKCENLEHAVALTMFHYNFCRIHQSLRVTPAMEAGVTDRLWDVEDIVGLLERAEAVKAGAGSN